MRGLRSSATWGDMGLTLAMTGVAIANINLELRARPEPCATRIIRFDLYAVSDSGVDQSIAAMDVILTWDPNALQFQGSDTSGPYPYNWMFSGFQNDHSFDGLNDTWEDGSALYTALAQLGVENHANATPAGLLVTTFKCRKREVGALTSVTMPRAFGDYSETVVYDGHTPGLDVTGTLAGDVSRALDPGRRELRWGHQLRRYKPVREGLEQPVGLAV